MHWKWEKIVRDVLNVTNYVREVMNVRELCKMFTESEITMLELYWVRENHELNVRTKSMRCAECEKTM